MIKFGPSGSGQSFIDEGGRHTVEIPKWLQGRGLDLYEYSFGRGVSLTRPTAEAIGAEFAKENIEISVHAPYYINLASPDEEKANNSYGYILQSLETLRWLGGRRCVVHCGSEGKLQRKDAVALIESRLQTLVKLKDEAGYGDLLLCVETMGKKAQIGDVAEICGFCKIAPCIYPCIDFGHVNARDCGSLKSEADFDAVIKYMINEIGREKTADMHVHFSKIEYSAKGEIRHLTFADDKYGPDFSHLAPVIVRYGLTPYVVSESAGTQAEDAKLMKDAYLAELSK